MAATLRLVTIFMPAILSVSAQNCNSDEEDRAFIYPDNYKKNDAPILNLTAREGPLKVQIDMDVWSISEISLIKQEIEVDVIVTVYWYDWRLKVNASFPGEGPWIRLGEETFEVWRPTLLFLNCKGCLPLSLGTSIPMFVKRSTGQFWAQQRIVTKFGCAINLRAYPMDIQNCAVQLYTNDRGDKALLLQHLAPDKNIHPSSGITLSEFFIPSIKKAAHPIRPSGGASVSSIELRIKFVRLIAYHFTTSYAPTTFIVILSWISFWLPTEVVPARIALGLTSLLTLATRLDQAQRNLPPVSYVKAIDVWMFACITMVSATLLEFAVSHYLSRQCKKKAAPAFGKPNIPNTVKIQPFELGKDKTYSLPRPKTPQPTNEQDDSFLDRISRIMFPTFFIVFNVIYWSYYACYYD